ncbi:hypothetical protein MPC4_500003 [Methylocella tundrae]|uniref:Uncharacterized protein n=1 Tax=Methylocella tundrae TaxID=227605 RepID=A0A8B6MA38_METTU|nr:hypothetical protein MPC4_500003 [Methylocella tundrae]
MGAERNLNEGLWELVPHLQNATPVAAGLFWEGCVNGGQFIVTGVTKSSLKVAQLWRYGRVAIWLLS